MEPLQTLESTAMMITEIQMVMDLQIGKNYSARTDGFESYAC